MKKFLATTALVSAVAFAAPAMAQEQQCENNASVSNDSGRLFANQGMDFYQGSTWTFDYTLSCGNYYANFWHAQTGRRAFNETDVRVGYANELSNNWSYDASFAFYELAGPEAYELSGEVTYTITNNWSVSGDINIVRGGFKTDTFLGEVAWSDELFGSVSGNASTGVSFDTWSEDTVGHLSLGVSSRLIFEVVGSISAKGFVVIDEGNPSQSNDEDGAIISLALSRAF